MDIMGLMKKAQAMQAKMKDVQEELERSRSRASRAAAWSRSRSPPRAR